MHIAEVEKIMALGEEPSDEFDAHDDDFDSIVGDHELNLTPKPARFEGQVVRNH